MRNNYDSYEFDNKKSIKPCIKKDETVSPGCCLARINATLFYLLSEFYLELVSVFSLLVIVKSVRGKPEIV